MHQNKFNLVISFVIIAICLSISIILVNRAFVVGSICSIIFLLISYNVIRFNKKVLGLIVGFIIVLVCSLAFLLKSNSSLGRLLIYKISFKMFSENLATGIGLGNFKREYGLYQAKYFEAGNYTQKEFLLAGNTYYAFNDYLQFIVETGLFGFAFIVLLSFLTLKLFGQRLREEPSNILLKTCISIIITIGVAALFTHVFEKKIFVTIMIIALVYCLVPKRVSFKRYNLSFPIILWLASLLCLWQYYYDIKNLDSYRKLEEAKTLISAGYIIEGKNVIRQLYPVLNKDLGYLKYFEGVLSPTYDKQLKLTIVTKICESYTDYEIYLKFAEIHDANGNRKVAESLFLKSVYIVPNRFIPKQALYKFYVKNKQLDKAQYWKAKLMTMPVKIPSKIIDEIKQNLNSNLH